MFVFATERAPPVAALDARGSLGDEGGSSQDVYCLMFGLGSMVMARD